MSFHPIRIQVNNSPGKINQPPKFIIPGIYLNKNEALFLADELDQLDDHNSAIYLYNDERLQPNGPSINNDLKKQIDGMVSELLTYATFKPFPFELIGYSYGGPLLIEVALRLQALGHEVHTFIIDAPSPNASQAYFQANPTSLTEDLKNIFNYGADLCTLLPAQFDENKMRTILKDSLAQQEGFVIDAMLGQHCEPNKMEKFKKHLNVCLRNLQNLKNGLFSKRGDLPKINLLMLKETDNKYRTKNGNWDQYTTDLNLVQDPVLCNKQHVELLKKENCRRLASLITETFRKEIKMQIVFQNAVNFYLNELQRNHPDVDVKQAAKFYSENNSKSNQSSNNRPQSQDEVSLERDRRIVADDPMEVEQVEKKPNHSQQFKLFAESGNGLLGSRYNTRKQDQERARRFRCIT